MALEVLQVHDGEDQTGPGSLPRHASPLGEDRSQSVLASCHLLNSLTIRPIRSY